MYNNQKRVELVKRRIYERNCQQQRHGIYGLSADCLRRAWFYLPFLQECFMWWQGIHRWRLREWTVLSCCIKMQEAMCL